jgi:hypothetical protein
MGYTLTFRTCQRPTREQEAAVRLAADAFNQGRTWVLTVRRDERDGHLTCSMEPIDPPGGGPARGGTPGWPGAYEAQCLLEGMCGISRDCKMDWEIHDPYGLRPIGTIRGGDCHSDPEAQSEATRNMGDVLRRRARG